MQIVKTPMQDRFVIFSCFCSNIIVGILKLFSNKYTQFMFKSKNKYLYASLLNLSFTIIKVGFDGVELYRLDCLHD